MKSAILSVLAAVLFINPLSAQVEFDRGGSRLAPRDLAASGPRIAVSAPVAVEDPTPEESDVRRTRPGNRNTADWTIMVYINAKNDLETYGLQDMNEMEAVGSTDRVNIIVQFGRMSGYDAADGDWTGVRRFRITRDNDRSAISSAVLENLGAQDMGDYRKLAEFGAWTKTNYPARKYMLVVWNHGDGWLENRKVLGGGSAKGISYDEETGNHMTTPELAYAVAAMGGVDVYGSDACLMQMAEVAYELRGAAQYIVGSEELEPFEGYDYTGFLGPLVAEPGMDARGVARLAVDAYTASHAGRGQATTQSYLASASLPGLLELTNSFSRALRDSGEKILARSARDGALAFDERNNKDMYDFARLVAEGAETDLVRSSARSLMEYISGTLIERNGVNGAASASKGGGTPRDYSRAKGIAAYIPSEPVERGYSDLRWAADSGWDELITWINANE